MSDEDRGVRWRLIVDQEGRAGSWNMALDHALAECAGPNEGVLRLYSWDPFTISFGRNEPSAGLFDLVTAAEEGLGFVRRPTGGRAVLHAEEVTYAVILPARALGGLREAYVKINEGLVEGLRSLGAPVEMADEGPTLSPDAGPCFQAPAPGEVMVAGRKLVGSAQVRIGSVILQHGSIILRGDQETLSRLSGRDVGGVPPAGLEEFAATVSREEVSRAVSEGIGLALGGSWRQADYHLQEIERAKQLERARYGTDEWTWRR